MSGRRLELENKLKRSWWSDTSTCCASSNRLIQMEIPKSEYNVGDRVIVRCEESEDFEATISRVWWDDIRNRMDYEVTEPDGGKSDGYTDDWLLRHVGVLPIGGTAGGK